LDYEASRNGKLMQRSQVVSIASQSVSPETYDFRPSWSLKVFTEQALTAPRNLEIPSSLDWREKED